MGSRLHARTAALAAAVAATIAWSTVTPAQDAPESSHDAAEHAWLHEDLEAGYRAAQESGKPLLVAFR